MVSIVMDNISVSYPVLKDHYRSLRRDLMLALRQKQGPRAQEVRAVQALENISLTLKDGDRVGLIGDNGAGKSTLLRILGGFLLPDSGTLLVEGRMLSLLGVDGCLNPDKTGHDNIFYVGRLLGLLRRDMESHIPDIESLSGLRESLHLPVHSYSEGMKMRLGMAIMSCVRPDILVFDEAIGACDAHFIDAFTSHLQRVYDRARIVVMASHSQAILRKLCNKAIWLRHGRIVKAGPLPDILDEYGSEASVSP